MPTPAPISGLSIVNVGYSITLTDSVTGGTWSSSNTAFATVSDTGVVTGIAVGSVVITYTLSGQTATLTIAVNPVMITNGFNVNDLFPVFQKRLGWIQTTLSGYPVVDTDNATAYSGRYYNDNSFHSAVTIQNIKDTFEDPNATDDQFNALLDRLDKSSICRVVNSVFNKPAFVEHRVMFVRNYFNLTYPIANGLNFVGHRLNIAPGNLAIQIDAITLYFDGVATFNLYLFNDMVPGALFTKSVTTVANTQIRISTDWALNYINLHNIGGMIYIGYFQADLGNVHALDERYNLWADTCTFGGLPFQSLAIGNTDFQRNNPSIMSRTYGMNIEVTVYRDYTQTILQMPHLFDNVRGLCMAIIVLSLLKNTDRTNLNERAISSFLADWRVDTDLAMPTENFPFAQGLKMQLTNELKKIGDAFWPKQQPMSVPIGGASCGGEYLGMPLNNLPTRQTLT